MPANNTPPLLNILVSRKIVGGFIEKCIGTHGFNNVANYPQTLCFGQNRYDPLLPFLKRICPEALGKPSQPVLQFPKQPFYLIPLGV
jgi:hypothetical protein